jgi:poly(hydroxyalkanoate) depolymerase family esterase
MCGRNFVVRAYALGARGASHHCTHVCQADTGALTPARPDADRQAPRRLLARAIPAAVAAAVALALPACAQAATDLGPAPDCGCGNVTQYTYDGPTAAATGSDTYLVFTPNNYTGRKHVPLVVVTHGTNTTAAEQEAANDYDRVAEKYGFIVMYPDDNDDIHPGGGWAQSVGLVWQPDAELIAGMTRAVIAGYDIDTQRVYEIGMSAGAIITSDLAATYPNLYAAVGIMAGAPFGSTGLAACETGEDPAAGGDDAQLLLDSYGAYHAEGSNARVMPVIVLNGDADTTVNPVCDQLAVEQWLTTDNLVIGGQTSAPLKTTAASDTPGQVPGGHSYGVYDYTQPSGCLIAQHWIVHGMAHDWSGGTSNPAYSQYTDPKGPSASAASWAFFSHFTLKSTGRPCADVKGSRGGASSGGSVVEGASANPTMTGHATGIQQATAQPVNTLTAYRNRVSIAYRPTSGACFSSVAATSGCLAYSSVALQAAGATPGNVVTVGGFDFQWPNTLSGQPDSVSPAGQTIPVNAPLGTNTVAILGAAQQGLTSGPSSTVVDLHYATPDCNGEDADVGEVSFPNWSGLVSGLENYSSATAQPNELRSDFQILNSTVPVSAPASVYAVSAPVDPARKLVSVTFADTDPSIRMFDLQTATTGDNQYSCSSSSSGVDGGQ